MDENNNASSMVRVGIVSSVDAQAKCARVIFPDKGLVSGQLYVLQHKGSDFMPAVNDKVLCLFSSLFNGDGFILGVIA